MFFSESNPFKVFMDTFKKEYKAIRAQQKADAAARVKTPAPKAVPVSYKQPTSRPPRVNIYQGKIDKLYAKKDRLYKDLEDLKREIDRKYQSLNKIRGNLDRLYSGASKNQIVWNRQAHGPTRDYHGYANREKIGGLKKERNTIKTEVDRLKKKKNNIFKDIEWTKKEIEKLRRR